MGNILNNVDALFNSMEIFTQKKTHSDKTFLPVMSVTVGFGGGDINTMIQAGQANTSAGMAMGGGTTAMGAKLCTDAGLVIDKDNVMIAPIGTPGNISQIMDKVPKIVSNISSSGGQQQGG